MFVYEPSSDEVGRPEVLPRSGGANRNEMKRCRKKENSSVFLGFQTFQSPTMRGHQAVADLQRVRQELADFVTSNQDTYDRRFAEMRRQAKTREARPAPQPRQEPKTAAALILSQLPETSAGTIGFHTIPEVPITAPKHSRLTEWEELERTWHPRRTSDEVGFHPSALADRARGLECAASIAREAQVGRLRMDASHDPALRAGLVKLRERVHRLERSGARHV